MRVILFLHVVYLEWCREFCVGMIHALQHLQARGRSAHTKTYSKKYTDLLQNLWRRARTYGILDTSFIFFPQNIIRTHHSNLLGIAMARPRLLLSLLESRDS